MAGYIGPLPGMTYDHTRGKYFKTVTSHGTAAPPSAANDHSDKAIRRRNARLTASTAVSPRRALRSMLTDPRHSSLAGACLTAEIGMHDRNTTFDSQRRACVQRWEPTVKMRMHPVLSEQRVPIADFAYNPDMDVIYYATGQHPLLLAGFESIHNNEPNQGPEKFAGDHHVSRAGAGGSHPVRTRSVIYHPGLKMMLTICMDMHSEWQTVILGLDEIVLRRDPERERSITQLLPYPAGTGAGFLATDVSQVIRFNELGQEIARFSGPGYQRRFQSDLLDVEILAMRHAEIVALGHRNGHISIRDLRCDTESSQFDTVIAHPSAVTTLKNVGVSQLLVAGCEDKMCIYDLRFLKMEKTADVWDLGTVYSRARKKCSVPILQYAQYKSGSCTSLAVDVDVSAGLVAAAQDSDDCNGLGVGIFDLHGGQLLREISCFDDMGHRMRPAEHRGVQFVDDSMDRESKGLWLAVDGTILRWGA